MRAVLVAPYPPPINGNTVASQIVADGLHDMGWKIARVNLSSSSSRESGHFELSRVQEVLGSVLELRALLRREVCDVFYLTVAQSFWGMLRDLLLVREGQAHGLPIVMHLHGGSLGETFAGLPPWMRRIYRRYMGRADAAIVLDEGLRDQWAGIVPSERVFVVPNGVDTALIKAGAHRTPFPVQFSSEDPLKVLWLSNLIPTKGVGEVLEAAERLHTEGAPVEFTVAGGIVDPDVRAQVTNLSDRGVIQYVGLVSGKAKQEILLSHHVFVLPSYYPPEGQPISLLEAMASGLIPVVTEYRGMKGLVSHNRSGLFVPARSGEAVMRAINELLTVGGRLRTMSQTSYETVRHLDSDTYVENVRHVLEGVARSHGVMHQMAPV